MKSGILKIICLLLVLSFGCRQTSHDDVKQDHEHDATVKDEVKTNVDLYNEVMKIHDDVMPRMDDIHRLKKELRDKMESKPQLTQAERVQLDAIIMRLDSAGKGMMVWMRQFNPLPDSVGEDKARAYLESEMERIKKVRDDIQNAITEADSLR